MQAGAALARQFRDMVAPGAGRIDDDPCAECLLGGGHRPAAGFFQCRHRRIADERAAALLEQLQVGLVQQVDVDIGGAGIENDAAGIAVPQQRKPGLTFGDADFGHALLARHHRIESRLLAIGHEEQCFARAQKTTGIIFAARGAGERADGRRAVIRLIGRGRAAGGVIAGAVFHLEDADAVRLGQMGGHGSAGNARTNDDDIEVCAHGSPIAARLALAQEWPFVPTWLS